MSRCNDPGRWARRAGAALCGAVALAAAHAGDMTLSTPDGPYALRVTSLKEMRFASTMRQRYDFSCGSAAVATLLTYQYGLKVSEAMAFQRMYAAGNQPKIQREGFSMLDMKRYLDSLGYLAQGVEVTLDQLAEARVPAIALVRENNYLHFVVIKGLRGDRMLLGDPALGTRTVARDAFERIWMNGILLVVTSHTEQAVFNDERDWRARPMAPLRRAFDLTGMDTQLLRRGPMDY
ncbi:MAG: C39 family peptidase [Rhodocyclaceae bacterium]